MKTVLITGANRGIGKEVAFQLARKGFRVVVSARNEQAGEDACVELSQRLEQREHPFHFLTLDVASEESTYSAAQEYTKQFGDRLDVLINNAGIYPDGDSGILDVGSELLMQTIQTNTAGPILVTRAFLPHLRQADSGTARVINVSSLLGQISSMADGQPSYRISKAALNAVTRQLASALAEDKIAVNSVSPGWVRTEMGGPEAELSVEEGADSIVWLASESPQNRTGEFIRLRESVDW